MKNLRSIAAPAMLALAALVLRLWQLGSESFWIDEVLTASRSTKNPALLLHLLRMNNHPPLYFMLTQPLVRAFGLSEWTLRLPSALFGAASAWAIYVLARDVFPERFRKEGALLAGLFAAMAPAQVYYGQEARVYSMLALLSALHMLGLWRLLFSEKRLSGILLYGASAVLGVHAHYLFWTVFLCGLLAGACALLFGPWKARLRRNNLPAWLWTAMAGVLLFVPWYLYAPAQLHVLPGKIHGGHAVPLPWEMLGRALRPLAAVSCPYPAARVFDGIWLALPAFLVFFLACRRRDGAGDGDSAWRGTWAGLWAAFLFAGFYLAAMTRQAYLFERYFSILTAPLCLLAAWGLCHLPAWPRRALAACWTAAAIACLALVYYPLPQKTPWREIALRLEEHVPGKTFIRCGDTFTAAPLRYYLDPRLQMESFPTASKELMIPAFWQVELTQAQPFTNSILVPENPPDAREAERLAVSDFADLVRYERMEIAAGGQATP
jgi:4-amino-4-deoxy-L-arabinose transferase-like glycosyltransferase